MDLRARLVGELQHRGGGRLVQLDPFELAASVANVLDSASVTVSLVQPLARLPIAASDRQAAVAEQVQASVGTGPCLMATLRGAPVRADETELEQHWPVYHQLLTSRTRFRSTASFPLSQAGGVFAALDVYSEETRWRRSADLGVIQAEVADLVAMMLLGLVRAQDRRGSWPTSEQARCRQQVWIAVGMVCEVAALDDADAMAVLRAYAFAHDRLLDEVADDMLAGRLVPEAVVAAP